MLGFFIAFAVKLPVVPVHTWLPDAHTEAPTAGSIILAGLMLKTGAYGILRFIVPLFPTRRAICSGRHGLGSDRHPVRRDRRFRPDRPEEAGRLYQRKPPRFRSPRHLCLEPAGASGCRRADDLPRAQHGRRSSSWSARCRYACTRANWTGWADCGRRRRGSGGAGLFFAMASLGLPGLGDFVGEFLVLIGTYRVSPTLAVLAATGVSGRHILRAEDRTTGVPRPQPAKTGRFRTSPLREMAGGRRAQPQPALDRAVPETRAQHPCRDHGFRPPAEAAARSLGVSSDVHGSDSPAADPDPRSGVDRGHGRDRGQAQPRRPAGLTVVGLSAALVSLWPAAAEAPRQVTDLLSSTGTPCSLLGF